MNTKIFETYHKVTNDKPEYPYEYSNNKNNNFSTMCIFQTRCQDQHN